MSKMFSKLVVCSLILEVHISKCHLEVVALSLIICLECEEVTHVEEEKRDQKKRFCSFFWMLRMNLVLLEGDKCSDNSED